MKAVEAAHFEQRERKRDALAFLRAMLTSAASPAGGRQADIMRTYFENGAPRVARGSFYDWFGPALEEVMQALAECAMEQVRAREKVLPGILGCVKDWRIVDSMTVRLHDDLSAAYPGTEDYAALELHKTLSAGCGSVIDYHLSPAREHDSPHLTLEESWRGMGLLVVSGYASLERLCGVFVAGHGYFFYSTNLPRSVGGSLPACRRPAPCGWKPLPSTRRMRSAARGQA